MIDWFFQWRSRWRGARLRAWMTETKRSDGTPTPMNGAKTMAGRGDMTNAGTGTNSSQKASSPAAGFGEWSCFSLSRGASRQP